MITFIKSLFSTVNSVPRDTSSEFSRFFRTASSGEKKKVFLEVAQKATQDQLAVLK